MTKCSIANATLPGANAAKAEAPVKQAKNAAAQVVHHPMPSAARGKAIAPPALPAVQVKTRAQKKALFAVPMVSRA